MPRFFRRFAEGVFDVQDLKFRTAELAEFVEGASSHYGFDRKSVVAVGYSNGANIGVSLLFLAPEDLRGAVLFRPLVPLVPEKKPNLTGRHVYVSSGRTDPIVPRNQSEKLAKMLQDYGADVSLNWEDTDHSLVEGEVQRASDWIRENFR